MTELLLVMMPIFLMVLALELGPRLARVLRDRQIDREIDENMWRA